MCGITGILGIGDANRSALIIEKMSQSMAHRGPDADGIFSDVNIALGHRRLAIIDLDPRGNQPMTSPCGRYVMVFNGEIYNYQSLKLLVSNYQFQSATDTEVVLALFIQNGVEILKKLEGMFAFAIWDKQQKELFIARDRFGKKPFYYHVTGGTMIFASEIRSILAADTFKPILNKGRITEFLQYQTVLDPETLVQGVLQLPAGCFAVIHNSVDIATSIQVNIQPFYKLGESDENTRANGPYQEVVKNVRELFFEAVSKRLVADVDFGAFLSGGIDSSAVVAAMSMQLDRPVKTFHVYFNEGEFSERKYADLISKKYHTDHKNILIQPNVFLSEVELAIKAIDHPSADGINTYVVSKFTRAAGVKMALSGLGGDELFAGYPVFKRLTQLNHFKKLGLFKIIDWIPQRLIVMALGRGKAAELFLNRPMSIENSYLLFRQLMGNAQVREFVRTDFSAMKLTNRMGKSDLLKWISISEMQMYMKPVLLRDTDQMSMAHALEVRAPFLDHKLVNYVLNLPDAFKPLNPGKKLFIDAMGEDLPKEIWDRRKMGFVFPWRVWVNQELKSLVDEGLQVIESIDYLRPWLNELRKYQAFDENPKWYNLWLLSTLGHWMKNNKIGG